MQGLAGVNQRSNCSEMLLWLPNLVGRIPDQSVMDYWGQKTCRGQPEVKLPIYAQFLPNLVGRTPDQIVMLCWVKGHAAISRSQSEVKLLNGLAYYSLLLSTTPKLSADIRALWSTGALVINWDIIKHIIKTIISEYIMHEGKPVKMFVFGVAGPGCRCKSYLGHR